MFFFIIFNMLVFSLTVFADISCLGSQFKGACHFVINSGTINCGIGTTIVAYRISGSSHVGNDTYTTVSSGVYGNKLNNGQPNLGVKGSSSNVGETINFTINSFSADQTSTFACGAAPEDLALTVTDTQLPILVSIVKANNSYLNATDKLNITVSDNKGISMLTFDNGNGINTTFTNNTLFSPAFTTDGNYYISFYIKDMLGNIYAETYNYSYDTTKPKIETITKINNSYLNSTDQITITINDANFLSSMKYKVGESQLWINSNGLTFTPGFSTQGNNYLHIWINDSADNINITTYNFSYDSTTPQFIDVGPTTTNSTDKSSLIVTLWASLNERGTCVYGTANNSFSILALMNTVNELNHTINLTFTADGTFTYYVKCNDTAGNINVDGNSTTFSVNITEQNDNSGNTPNTGPGGGGDSKSPTTSLPATSQATSTPLTPIISSGIGGDGATETKGEEGSLISSKDETQTELTTDSNFSSTALELSTNLIKDRMITPLITFLKTRRGSIILSFLLFILLIIAVLLIIIKNSKKKEATVIKINS